MRKIAKRIAIGVGIAITLFALFYVRPLPFQNDYNGFLRRHLLISEIKGGHKITAIKHTDQYDEIDKIDQYQEKILQTKVLSDHEITELLNALPRSKDRSDYTFLRCIYSPHHRIEIERADRSIFIWEICFTCGEHQLPDDANRILPDGWKEALASFFKGIGMDPEVHKRKR